MSLDLYSRRKYRHKKFEYLLDDEEKTARLTRMHIGRVSRFRIPDHVTDNGIRYDIVEIWDGAIRNPKTLRHLIIPDSVTYVGEHILHGEDGLRTVYIGKGLECFGGGGWNNLFHNRAQIIIDKENPYLKIENGLLLTKDGKWVITALGSRAHYDIPEGVETIGDYAFSWRKKCESVSIPSTLKTIRDNGFGETFGGPRKVLLPEGFEQMVVQAFLEAANLEVLDLPSTLKDFGWQNIVGCKKLHVLTIRCPEMLEIQPSGLRGVPTKTCHLFVPGNLLESYRKNQVWGRFKHIHAIHDKPELMFHCGGTKMFIDKKTGELHPDDVEHTLEELIAQYEDNCDAYSAFMKKKKEAEAPYRKTKIKNGREVTYIDYDAWEEEDSDSFWNYGLCEFNGYNCLEMLEWDIDLKIVHINRKNGVEIPETEDFRKMRAWVNSRKKT